MVPGSDWKGTAEANSRPQSRGSGGRREWGTSPQSCPPGGVVSPPGQGARQESPAAPRSTSPPLLTCRGSSRGHGPLEQDTRHPKPGSRAQSAPPRDFPLQMGTLKPGDYPGDRVETLFRGLATSKDQGSDWDLGSLGRNCHTSSSF